MEYEDFDGNIEKIEKEQKALADLAGNNPVKKEKSLDYFLTNIEDLEPGTLSALVQMCPKLNVSDRGLKEKINQLCS